MTNRFNTLKAVMLWLAYVSFILFVAATAAMHHQKPVGVVAWAILGLTFLFIIVGQQADIPSLQRYLTAPRALPYTLAIMAVVAALLAVASSAA